MSEYEKLDSKWIDKNVVHVRGLGDIVEAEAVESLLVPKQDLPVIPKYVAEWIEDIKSKKINLLESIYDFTHGEDIHNYMREQGNVLMRAWLDGYTVEEEQRYYILDSDDIPLLERVDNQVQRSITELSIYEKGRDNSRFKLTEQEIKGYDKRYWSFAERVEQADFRLLF